MSVHIRLRTDAILAVLYEITSLLSPAKKWIRISLLRCVVMYKTYRWTVRRLSILRMIFIYFYFFAYIIQEKEGQNCAGWKWSPPFFFFFLLFWRILLWVGITSKRRRRSFRNILRAGWMFSVRWAWLCPLNSILLSSRYHIFFYFKDYALKNHVAKKKTFRTVTKRYTFKCCTTTKRIAEVNAVVDD